MTHETPISPEIIQEQALAKAEQLFRRTILRETYFIEHYGEAAVKHDTEYVNEKEERFRQEATAETKKENSLATILEGIWHDQVSRGWFGKNVKAIRPTRYDDIYNGIDSILEFKKSAEKADHLALGIDVTFGIHVGRKLARATHEIQKNRLAEVKYFSRESGKLRNVPRVVIGIERHQINRLAEHWVAEDQSTLKDDPIQIIILDEIKMQIVAFKQFAKRNNRENLIPYYNQVERIVDQQIAAKKDLRSSKAEEIANIKQTDRVYQSLENFVSTLNPPGTDVI